MGRCGDNGDELGSQIIAARLVRDVMQLCFLMERKYTPYSKWFGTAFAKLKCARAMTGPLAGILSASSWHEREQYLSKVYVTVAKMHNALGITQPMPTKVSPFHGRPFLVIHGDFFADEIRKAIRSKTVRNIGSDIGSVDQFADCTDLTENSQLCRKLKVLF